MIWGYPHFRKPPYYAPGIVKTCYSASILVRLSTRLLLDMTSSCGPAFWTQKFEPPKSGSILSHQTRWIFPVSRDPFLFRHLNWSLRTELTSLTSWSVWNIKKKNVWIWICCLVPRMKRRFGLENSAAPKSSRRLASGDESPNGPISNSLDAWFSWRPKTILNDHLRPQDGAQR